MTNVTTIDTSEGNIKIEQDKFNEYMKEAFEHLGAIESAKDSLKDVVEIVADNTGMKKGKVSKYFKERYNASTKKTKELGLLFSKLDEVVENR